MALAAYMIALNNGAPQTLAAAGIGEAQLVFSANGVDTLTLDLSVASFHASGGYVHLDKISIIQRSDDHPTTPDVCIFHGTVEEIPRHAVGGGRQSRRYVVKGPSHDLQLCHFSQQWTYRDAGGISTKDYEPVVCLGESSSGARLTSGQQIAEAVDYAILRGVGILKGTIASGVTVPFDERSNIMCWDVVVSMLRFTPDYVLHWDYNTKTGSDYTPTCHVTAPASMSAKSKAVTSLSAAEFVPRHDIQVPGLTIIFNYTDTIDGQTSRTRVTQTAGTTDNPRSLFLAYDLEGVNITYLKQEVEVEDYPADWTGAAGKTFLADQIPWLSDLDPDDWSVISVDRSGTDALPARLIEGSIADWMSEDQEQETFTATVSYIKKDSGGGLVEQAEKQLSFSCLSTSATSKTYRKQGDFLGPEPVPSNLAANLYASWSRLHWDGQLSYKAQLCPADILPGHKVNVTSALAAWASMDAIVQDAALNLADGSTVITCGTCGRLEADNLLAIFRAARGRSFCYRRQSRDEPDSTSGDIPGTGSTALSDTADGSPAERISRMRIVAEDINEDLQVIDLFPASVAYAESGNEAPRTIAPREFLMPYLDGTVAKAKLAQVLCSDLYGDAVTLGGGRPADSTYPKVLGSASETDLTSQAAYDPASPESGKDGVALVVSLGSFYDDTAGTPVLKDFRVTLTWPNATAPKISAVTAVTIDTPQP